MSAQAPQQKPNPQQAQAPRIIEGFDPKAFAQNLAQEASRC